MAKYKKSTKEKLTQISVRRLDPKSRKSLGNNLANSGNKKRSKKKLVTTSESGQAPNGQIWLYGNHAVNAALTNPKRTKYRLLVNKELVNTYKPANNAVQPEFVSRQDIEQKLPPNAVHQGLTLLVAPLKFEKIETVCNRAEENSILIILDQVSDPRNIGAIMRSASAFGASAIVTTGKNSPETSAWLAKAASGAVDRLPLVKVTNLVRTIGLLKEAGFWTVGLDVNGSQTLAETKLDGKLALILGAEGRGLRRLTAKNCDYLVSIPIKKNSNSLNVSAAAAIALYEIVGNRAQI